MASQADLVFDSLHAGYEQLAPLVRSLTPEQLVTPTKPGEWTVHQVLGHIGSGAVITEATLEASLAGLPNPGLEANKAIWAVWDAKSPQACADDSLAANEHLLARYDSLDDATLESLRIDLGFLPAPLDVAGAAAFRLNEFALHSWDVRAFLDPSATIEPSAVPLIVDVEVRLGWISKPESLGRPATVRVELTDLGRSFILVLAEHATIGNGDEETDAVLRLPAEVWVRLATGRLAPAATPGSIELSGSVTLDELRAIFPGF
jgi:uncharacterized protein (TIGR03083 family)